MQRYDNDFSNVDSKQSEVLNMKVFISRASTDAKLAKRVADVLKEAGFEVWDDTQILPGENWGEKLAEALTWVCRPEQIKMKDPKD